MYKMEINISGQQRMFLFRGPGCRKAMFEWWRDHLSRVAAGEDIRSIRVWGTVGNKTDIVLEWPLARATLTEQPLSSVSKGAYSSNADANDRPADKIAHHSPRDNSTIIIRAAPNVATSAQNA